MHSKVDKYTKVIINGQEVLSSKGIGGHIREVGVGFGTARHTSGRYSSELPGVVYEIH